jgi:hypothetical protein
LASSSLRSCFCGKFRLKSSCISVGCQRACFRKAISIEGRELTFRVVAMGSIQRNPDAALSSLPAAKKTNHAQNFF